MSWLVWQRDGEARISSPRRVLRAAEVPLLQDAQALRDHLDRLCRSQQAHVEAACDEGRAAGHAQGLEAGRRDAAGELTAALLAVERTAALERDRLRGEVGVLALQVVRKLLGHFAPDEVLAALAATAAHELLASQPLVLWVHPDAVAAVTQRLDRALDCEVRGDDSLAVDTCRLETPHGVVDASLHTQLERLEAAWAAAGASPQTAGSTPHEDPVHLHGHREPLLLRDAA